jgi:hypothetical protein
VEGYSQLQWASHPSVTLKLGLGVYWIQRRTGNKWKRETGYFYSCGHWIGTGAEKESRAISLGDSCIRITETSGLCLPAQSYAQVSRHYCSVLEKQPEKERRPTCHLYHSWTSRVRFLLAPG